MANSFFSIDVGRIVACGDHRFKVTHILSSNAILGKDVNTEEVVQLRIDILRPVTDVPDEEQKQSPDISKYSKEQWGIALHRQNAIQPLIDNLEPTRKLAAEIAEKAGVSIPTIYRWRDAYLKAGNLSSLVPDKRGRKDGTTFIGEEQETLIKSVIEELFLSRQRHLPQYVVEEVIKRCKTAQITPPHPNTIRHRIAALKDIEVLRRRGHSDIARNLYRAIESQFPGADSPLAVVQVDHTEADIILVEETTRLPIGGRRRKRRFKHGKEILILKKQPVICSTF